MTENHALSVRLSVINSHPEALLLVVFEAQKSKLGGYHLMTATFVRADIPQHCTTTYNREKRNKQKILLSFFNK